MEEDARNIAKTQEIEKMHSAFQGTSVVRGNKGISYMPVSIIFIIKTY